MTDVKLEKVARQVAAMMALALDQAGTPEGELAQQKADEMRVKYGITAAARTHAGSAADSMKESHYEIGKVYWKQALFGSVAILCDCFVYLNGPRWFFCGRESDVQAAMYLIDSLCNQCIENNEVAKREYAKAHNGSYRGAPRGPWRESFARGVADKVGEVARARKAAVQAADGSTVSVVALALVNRTQEAETWVRKHVALSGRRTSGGMKEGHDAAGYAAGKAANLGQGIGGGQRRLR